jgi:hypothetical protein
MSEEEKEQPIEWSNTSELLNEPKEISQVVQNHVFLWINIAGGMFGVDKVYKGKIILAIFKWLTLGGLGLWWIADIYVVANEAGNRGP